HVTLHLRAGIDKVRRPKFAVQGETFHWHPNHQQHAKETGAKHVLLAVIKDDPPLPLLPADALLRRQRLRQLIAESSQGRKAEVNHHDRLIGSRMTVMFLMELIEPRANRAEVSDRPQIFCQWHRQSIFLPAVTHV